MYNFSFLDLGIIFKFIKSFFLEEVNTNWEIDLFCAIKKKPLDGFPQR